MLPLVGLAPVIGAGADAPPAVLCVRFGGNRQHPHTPAAPFAPALLTIAVESAPPNVLDGADLVTDSAIAAVCFILSRVLGLATPFLTADAKVFDVVRAAIALARGDAQILLEGEIGVGKESLVKLIYSAGRLAAGLEAAGSGSPRGSPQAGLPGLLHAECAGLSADAVDAEIAPLLARASIPDPARGSDGMIFFNRIGELTAPAQRKLLDLLRSFAVDARDRRPARASVRLLAASTLPLSPIYAGGNLLPELHHLFDATLRIAPLRARRGDLPLLVRHYLRTLDASLTLNAAALRALSVYPFPGNVLELINFVTRVAIVLPGAGSRRTAIGSPATGIVGRAEVISQLDCGRLNTIWHSRDRGNSRRVRARGKNPAASDPPAFDKALPAQPPLTPVSVPQLAASMRLTASAVPRLRKPRRSDPRPRA